MTASRDRETDRAVIAHLTLGHSMVETAAANRSDRAFIGHPTGLGWLSFCEFWERFSYYGMQALLVLYMTHSLLHPGHVEHVLGFEPFRSCIASPSMAQACRRRHWHRRSSASTPALCI